MSKNSRNVMSFDGGIHPAGDGKSLSAGSPVRKAPLLDRYTVVISESVGKPPKPVVKAGDEVKKHQLIAEKTSPISFDRH